MRPAHPTELLSRAKTKALLLSSLVNIRYCSGLTLSAGLLLVLPQKMMLFVDDRYKTAAMKEVRKGVRVKDLAALPHVLKRIPVCGFETDSVTVEQHAIWKKKFLNTKFVQSKEALRYFRRSKEADELRNLHAAEQITEKILRMIPQFLRKGVTEREVAAKIAIAGIELGAERMSFDPIVGFGSNTARPHHHPTHRCLAARDIVQIDIGAVIGGYSADRSEVYFTKEPTSEQANIYDTLCDARDCAIAAAKPGASTRALDRIARDVLRKEGINKAFCHSLGHGVGLEIHEGVTISGHAKDEKLLKNEVITIEPGVYFPGRFGMRVESMVYVH